MIAYCDIHTEGINKVYGLHWGGEEGVLLALQQVVCIVTAGL